MSQAKPSNRGDLLICAGVLVFSIIALFVYFPYSTGYGENRRSVGRWLYTYWTNYPDWQHGILVPFVVGFLVWYVREKWLELPINGSKWGLGLIVLALLFYWVGYKANVVYVGMASCHMIIVGGILWLLGWKHVKALIFPIMFLSFAWPLFFLGDAISFKLRIVMCEISSGFLNFVGLENLRVGTSIVSPADSAAGLAQGERFGLDIESPCSGLRSLFALTMVSALFGFFSLKQPWKRWFLFGASLPLAMLGNFVRILLLVFGTLFWGSEFAIGKDGGTSDYHFLAGIAVFVVALGGMAVLAGILRGRKKPSQVRSKITKKRKSVDDKSGAPPAEALSRG